VNLTALSGLNLIQNIISTFFPEKCTLCPRMCTRCLCPECISKLPITWQPINTVTTLSSYHNSVLKDLLHHIKFKRNRRLSRWLGDYIATHSDTLPHHDAVWIPVPQHSRRLKQRGFNPLDDLFLPVLKKQGIHSQPIIQRIKETPALHGYSRKERFKMMKAAIAFTSHFQPHQIMNKPIVIYDDIYTTGATMETVYQLLSTYPIKSCHYVATTLTI
jgi:competence protein ComFC